MGMSVVTSSAAFVLAHIAGAGSNLPLLLIVPMFLLMYLMMIRPQQKKQKQWQAMLASIKAGDRITTCLLYTSPGRAYLILVGAL